jgi:hypothetical protein
MDEPHGKDKQTTDPQPQTSKREPYRVRLPGFITDEEIGLGDVIARATSTFGVAPCGGCKQRAARLNGWVAFSRKRS